MKNVFSALSENLVRKIHIDNINEITLRAGKNVTVKSDNIYYKIDYVVDSVELNDFAIFLYMHILMK